MALEWAAAAFILAIAVGLMGLLNTLAERRVAEPEILRKALHVAIGAIALSFPWLFSTPWPVIALAAGGILLLILVRSVSVFRRHLAATIDLADRQSVGDVCFLLSLVLLYLAAGEAPIFYVAPVLIMTLADAAAALAGTYLGRHRFRVPGGCKSLEGSAAFFLVALLCGLAALFALSEAGARQVVATAFILAATTTLLEAVSSNGLDNISIPMGAFLVLMSAS